MSDLLGQTIGNYRIEERLGVGGMGQVFKARHIHLDREVALKLIHEALALDPGFRERFRREDTMMRPSLRTHSYVATTCPPNRAVKFTDSY